MKRILAIAPHPDDETLGAGGTLLRHRADGHQLHWLVATRMTADSGFTQDQQLIRATEMAAVSKIFGFEEVHQLPFSAAKLDRVPMSDLVAAVSSVFEQVEPHWVYLPHYGDVHTDHRVLFDAVSSCAKWFRCSSLERVLLYETLSETGVRRATASGDFSPNLFIDITLYLERKIHAMSIFRSELGEFPFPRSAEAIKALAHYRGTQAGYAAAEAFVSVFERTPDSGSAK